MTTSKGLLTALAVSAFLAVPNLVHSAVVPLFTENLDAFDTQDLGDGSTYAVEIIPVASSPFNDGNAVRLFDFSTADKPELQGELSAPLLEPFRVDFLSFNQSSSTPAEPNSAIRFRMGNSGESISSEDRIAFSLSWEASGKVSAKFNDPSDGTGDVDTKRSSLSLEGVRHITMVANGALSGNYEYSLFGETRSLNPLSYDVYIDGELLNTTWANGMEFHYLKTGSVYGPEDGLQRFGLIGSSNANVDPDYLFDNIILYTGADIIPEPSSFALLLLGGLVLVRALKRRTQ